MNRRDFLTHTVRATLAGLSTLLLPARLVAHAEDDAPADAAQGAAKPVLYKGTLDGRILESTDGGKTWHVVANFGKRYAILKITQKDQLYAQVQYKTRTFTLKSRDARAWYTQSWVDPAAS